MEAPSIRDRRMWAAVMALASLALVVGFGAVNAGFYRGDPLRVDTFWMDKVGLESLRPMAWPALLLHEIGAGPLAFAIVSAMGAVLLLWGRRWGAVCFVMTAVVSMAVVELLKNSIGRPRPADAIVEVGYGSYPSGHSARAAMIAVVLGILLPRAWIWALGAAYTLAMMFSRTQLGAHWLSDTIAGVLTGGAAALLCFAVLVRKLEAEADKKHSPPWTRTI